MTSVPSPGGQECEARIHRDEAGIITWAEDGVADVLGWRPDDIIGRPSTEYIHPDDQPTAIAAWFDMTGSPGGTRVWRGRYRAADGSWVWLEVSNANQLAGPEQAVVTTLRRVDPEQASVEEELRAREQLLSRLSDALPVGLFQIDADRCVTFTNDRFHRIVGVPPAATLDAQFAVLDAAHADALAGAATAALGGSDVDDLELRAGGDGGRVIVLAMRPLTDRRGVVNGAVGCVSDVTDQVRLREELEVRAATDALTGCLNRAATFDYLATTLASRPRDGGFAVVFVDIDRFKLVNDRYGHAAGDALLAIAAARLRGAVREGDRVGRIGGDEFLIVCPGVDSGDVAFAVGSRASSAMKTTLAVGPRRIRLRASVGVAWAREAPDADSLVAAADAAMYRAKSDGSTLIVTEVPPRSGGAQHHHVRADDPVAPAGTGPHRAATRARA